MLRSCVLFFLIAFCHTSSFALDQQQAFIEQFKSFRVHFPEPSSPLLGDSPGRYPVSLDLLFKYVLGWVPTGEGKAMSSNCDSHLWSARLRDPRVSVSVQKQGALIQKYFLDCAAELATKENGSFSNFITMMTMKYAPQEHPFLHRIVINLPGDIKIKGLLGLKGDYRRRPLVVVRLGIFSSVEDFKPERAWMMMLFEQAPFNVLFVENMSSPDFVANNSQFSFGGYDEGIQNIQIARILKSPEEPISRLVSSIHMVGVSLGGHGVLFASLLNKFNSLPNSPLIQSFTALCPVVNLKPNMMSLTKEGMKSALVDLWSRQRLKGLELKIPDLVTFDNFSFLSKAVSEVARTYRGGISYVSSVRLPPGMKDEKNFWGLNDFWPHYRDVREPVLIYATKNDPAGPFEQNSQKIKNESMRIESKNIRVVELEHGIHCTLPAAYDWFSISTLLQSYILSHAPSFEMQMQSLNLDLDDVEWQVFLGQQIQLVFKVKPPSKKDSFVVVAVTLRNGRDESKELKLSLPLSQLDFKFRNPELSDSEKEMIVRWLNQNLNIKIISEGKKFILRASWPVVL